MTSEPKVSGFAAANLGYRVLVCP